MSRADRVETLIDQWRRERPDLDGDLEAMATIGRLGRLVSLMTAEIESVFEAHGLTIADFDVLAALRRAGDPFVLRPTDLARQLMLSPAGMTGRLDRLDRAGLVERRPDPDDRRSWLIQLSEQGRRVVDAAVSDHVANEARLLAPLTRAQRRGLDEAVHTLLDALD